MKIKISAIEIIENKNNRFHIEFTGEDGGNYRVSENGFISKEEAMKWATRNLKQITEGK